MYWYNSMYDSWMGSSLLKVQPILLAGHRGIEKGAKMTLFCRP